MTHIKLNNKLLDLSTPKVMGIVNLSPDSFYTSSRYISDKKLLNTIEDMLVNDVSIIDFGAYSTRPSALNIPDEEELKRLHWGIETASKKFPNITISVDTFRANVARAMAKNYDVAMINDISGGTLDPMMYETIADMGIAYVLMHTKGTPQNMQNLTNYNNLVAELITFFQKRITQLYLLGVKDIVIDPGFGFAKTTEQNFEILAHLSYLKELKVPILAGISRKSMIYKTLNTDAENALNGTTAANILALQAGATILRVHDVKEAQEAIKIYNAYNKAQII